MNNSHFRRDHQRPLSALLAAVLLSGCASVQRGPLLPIATPAAPAPATAERASDPLAANPDSLAEPVAEPTLIRGNDKMFNPPKARPGAVPAGPAVSLKFEQAPVTEVVHAVLGDILQLPYLINQPVSGALTIHTQSPLPRDKVLPVLEAVLQANGLAMVRDAAGVFHVGKPETLRGVAPSLGNAGGALPPGQNLVIVPLQFVGAAEMAEILKPVAPAEAFVRIDGTRNLLVLAGSRAQVEGWMDIVSTFDVDILKGMSIGLFPLKHGSVSEVDAALKSLLGGAAQRGGTTPPKAPGNASTAPGGTAGSAQQPPAEASALELPGPLGSMVKVVAIERLNALLVISPRAHYLDLAREWIEKFDQPRDGGNEPHLYVYPVQNGSATHLAGLLNGIFGGQTAQVGRSTDSGVAPGLQGGMLGNRNTGMNTNTLGTGSLGGGLGSLGALGSGNQQAQPQTAQVVLANNVRVVADEVNNALLIYAPRAEYTKIESALRRLDIAPTQVLIEATILEVSLKDDLKYGLQWYFEGSGGRNGWNGIGVLNSARTGAIAASQPGFSYSIVNQVGQVRAVLNALAEKSLINVISSPSVMVVDNHTAAIHVGDQQPIQSAQTTTDGGNTTTSIQYKDTGVMLSVTPSVNAGGMVAMNINQTVTDVGDIDVATGQRSFLQRQVSSRVAVRSGESIVLGGLIKDNTSRGRSGVPWLQDIPLIGSAFSTTTDSGVRTELLVMLTPRVVQSDAEVRQVGDELKKRMRALDFLPQRISAEGSTPAGEAR